jgi:hypothetical protein
MTWLWLTGQIYALPLGQIIYSFVLGFSLSIFQFWAMPSMIRPSAKRWFFANIIGFLVPSLFQYYRGYSGIVFEVLDLMLMFLPPAIAQAWALSARVKQSWLYALANAVSSFVYILLMRQIFIYGMSQLYLSNAFIKLCQAAILGFTLFYLQKYQSKESMNLAASYTSLALHEADEAPFQNELEELSQQERR